MLSVDERVQALAGMGRLVSAFYTHAVRFNVHPFPEFARVAPAGQQLPMAACEVDYLDEKRNCIFGGRITAVASTSDFLEDAA